MLGRQPATRAGPGGPPRPRSQVGAAHNMPLLHPRSPGPLAFPRFRIFGAQLFVFPLFAHVTCFSVDDDERQPQRLSLLSLVHGLARLVYGQCSRRAGRALGSFGWLSCEMGKSRNAVVHNPSPLSPIPVIILAACLLCLLRTWPEIACGALRGMGQGKYGVSVTRSD